MPLLPSNVIHNLLKRARHNVVLCGLLAVAMLSGVSAQAGALQFTDAGNYLVQTQESLQGSFTLKTQVKMDASLSGNIEGYWLAGFASQPGKAPDTLALAWSQVGDGWFGPMWGIQLASSANLIPQSQSLKTGNDFLEGYEYNRIHAGEPEWGHEYEVALGYTPKSGAVSVSVIDLTTKQTVVQQSLQIIPSQGELYPVAGYRLMPGSTASKDAAQVGSLQVLDINLPQGIGWWVAQQDSESGSTSYVNVIDRRKPASLQIQTPWQQLAGSLRFSLVGADSVTELLTIETPETDKSYPISVNNITPGKYVLHMDYVQGGRSWNIAQQDITVGWVSLQLANVKLIHDTEGKPTVSGELVASSDGPVQNLVTGVNLDLKRHFFQLGNTGGSSETSGLGDVRVEQGQSSLILNEKILQLPGDTALRIPFQANINLPTIDDKSVWQATLQSFAIPDTLVSKSLTESVWISPTKSALSWSGFLADEKQERIPVAPGVDAYRIKGRIPAGPIEMYMLEVDLNQPGITIDGLVGSHLATGSATRWLRSQVSKMVSAAGAVAGVNASFFEIASSMVPRSMLIRSGEMLRSPSRESRGVLGITYDGKAYIGEWQWQGEIRKPGSQAVRLDAINPLSLGGDGAALYRSPWIVTPGNTETNSASRVTEIVLQNVVETPGVLHGQVAEVRKSMPGVRLKPGQYVVSGRNKAADALAAMYQPGDIVDVVYEIKGTSSYPWLPVTNEVKGAASGGVVLVKNGVYGDIEVRTDTTRHPRTAAAVNADRSTLYLLVVDGRSQASVGMTYKEMADLFLYMGAFEALNLDGGGSSTLAVKAVDTGRIGAINTPSDGSERYVADGVGIFYTPQAQ